MRTEVQRRRFDVDDYHRMAQAGILSEDDRVELIDGEVVAMTPIGPRHNAAVDRALRALVTAAGDKAIVRVQGSIRLHHFLEPQPDLALLRPQPDFYASQLPGPADILLLIEVAESSLAYDRDVKARLYADAGVPEYWLVDLDHDVLLRHREPRSGAYQQVDQHRAGGMLAPAALLGCAVPVDVFLVA